MDLRELLGRLESSGFVDLAGAQISATIPISDRLLNEVLAAHVPPSGAVREMEIVSMPGDRFRIRARLAAAAFLPPLGTTVSIVQQPQFPARPTLVLQLGSGAALLSRLGGVLGFLQTLPPGVQVEGETIAVDLAELLTRQGHVRLLPLLERLHVTTVDGRVVLSFVVRVAAPATTG